MTPDPVSAPSPVTALRTLARIGAYLRPYRREVVYAAVALVVAAAAVLAVGQGLRSVIDHGFGASDGGQLDRALGLMLAIVIVLVADRPMGASTSSPGSASGSSPNPRRSSIGWCA